jgi:hypothetical protein
MPSDAGNVLTAQFLDQKSEAANGVGLSMSGGGYRAMLFHVGALLRLVEFGYLGDSRVHVSQIFIRASA